MMMNRFVTALLAGAVVGAFAAMLHFAFLERLITMSELYEKGALAHFSGEAQAIADRDSHTHGYARDHDRADAKYEIREGVEPSGSVLTRNLMTVVLTIFTWCGFALLLHGAMTVARHYDRTISARTGLLWGLAGFATFTVAPAMGLAPELPGTTAADLATRQIWWLGTAIATALALALLAFGRSSLAVVALALVALPHVIGAPEVGIYSGVAPPELAGEFAARTIGTAFLNWALLGWLLGRANQRENG